jgi:integrase
VISYARSAKRQRLYAMRPLADRFQEKVDTHGPTPAHRPDLGPCWIWRGSRDDKGYGQIREGGRGSPLLKAHRVSLMLVGRTAPDGMLVLHACDTPSCVRPEHLFHGSAKDNTEDARSKGRLRGTIRRRIRAGELAAERRGGTWHILAMVRGWQGAPRSLRNRYSTTRSLFRDAAVEGLRRDTPCILARGPHLPTIEDADSEWRSTAVLRRGELERLLAPHPDIEPDSAVVYALLGLAALRHGELAALRWRHYDPTTEPLGRLTIARSNRRGRTKAGRTRWMPVLPELAAVLARWRLRGWAALIGRPLSAYTEPDWRRLCAEVSRLRVRAGRTTAGPAVVRLGARAAGATAQGRGKTGTVGRRGARKGP